MSDSNNDESKSDVSEECLQQSLQPTDSISTDSDNFYDAEDVPQVPTPIITTPSHQFHTVSYNCGT